MVEAHIERQSREMSAAVSRILVCEKQVAVLEEKVAGLDELEQTVASQGTQLARLRRVCARCRSQPRP